jgi:hypothetical protein
MSTLKVGADHRLHASYGRYARHRTSRKQRRRLGFAWAILAAVTLLIAWDVAGRMDEVLYNRSFLG